MSDDIRREVFAKLRAEDRMDWRDWGAYIAALVFVGLDVLVWWLL